MQVRKRSADVTHEPQWHSALVQDGHLRTVHYQVLLEVLQVKKRFYVKSAKYLFMDDRSLNPNIIKNVSRFFKKLRIMFRCLHAYMALKDKFNFYTLIMFCQVSHKQPGY